MLRTLVLAVSLTTGCIVWEEGDATPTPECTPPPANDVDVTLAITDADAFAGNPANARFVVGTQVMSCSSALVPAAGDLALLVDGFGPLGDFAVELVLSADADPSHGTGDLTQTFRIGEDGNIEPDAPCAVHATWDLDFSATSSTAEAVTWQLGLGCPGL